MMPTLATLLTRPFSRVARELGLPPFRHHDILWSDHNLIAECPTFSGMSLPDRLRDKSCFIGPLIARLDVPIPDSIVRRGAGVRLRKRRFTAADVIAQVDRLCDDAAVRARVQDLRGELLAWDGPENAARYLESHFA